MKKPLKTSAVGSVVISLTVALAPLSVRAAQNDSADSERDQCTRNLKQIYQAIRACHMEERDLPPWLSDLVPKYLPDKGVLLCPAYQRTGEDQNFGMSDPKLPCSYLYEFCDHEVAQGVCAAVMEWKEGMTMKEWKTRQLLMCGADVPLVRCWNHTPLLNLAFSGEVYDSGQMWEAKHNLAALLLMGSGVPLPLEQWGPAGNRPEPYLMGIDPEVRYAGKPAARLHSKTPEVEGFGTYRQQFLAESFRGRRVRFAAKLKTEAVQQMVGLWMRVDGPDGDVLAFDNMQNRAIQGTVDWTTCEVVLDVPAEGQLIGAKVMLVGTGKAWIADLKFDEVSEDVPSTDLLKGGAVGSLSQSAVQSGDGEETAPAATDSALARELAGAWILVGTPGNVGEPPKSGGQLKFFGGGRWMVVQANPATGDVIFLHGGTFTLNGDEYVETSRYAVEGANYVVSTGSSSRFKISVEGDTYTQIGLGNPFSEVWKRMKSSSTPAEAGQALTGTWKLISAKYGGRAQDLTALGTTLKHVAPTQYLWLSRRDDTKIYRSAGGSCTITADTYAEEAEYGVGADFRLLRGETHKFNWKLEGSQWHHNGKLANGLTIEEIWERVGAR